ncbi:Retrovirus-related Pol polyprotein from transposon TNT 1-94-like protein, partial [Drosera capensis]
MDVKTVFLNGDIEETIYMQQPENFVSGDPKKMVCKLKKSIYRLKQASRQWYHKFHNVITSFGFEPNIADDCIYHKFSGSNHIFLVLCVDDILLASNDIELLHETKRFLSKKFEMKDLGDVSFVLGIQIHRDRLKGDTPVAKGDKFSLNQCPKNGFETKEMEKTPYASAVGSLMYAQPNGSYDTYKEQRKITCSYIGGRISLRSLDHDPNRVLKWLERLAILIDVGKAAHFLHTGIILGFFNNDLKMHNILLDEHRKANLSEYGLLIVSDDDDKPGFFNNDLKMHNIL